MNRYEELMKKNPTDYAVDYLTECFKIDKQVARLIIQQCLNDYNSLKTELKEMQEHGLTNEEIATKLNGHNYLCEENILCDINYKNILTTIYTDLSLCKEFTGYVENYMISKFNLPETLRDYTIEFEVNDNGELNGFIQTEVIW